MSAPNASDLGASDLPGLRRPLCLVGPRGAGKTSAGALLAERLERTFVDLDRALERRCGRSIPELLAEGLPAFRQHEASVLEFALAFLSGAERGVVIATGGGVVLLPQNRLLLRQAAEVAYLHADPEVLAARVSADAEEERPPLVEGGPLAEAQAVLAARDPLYREVAGAVVDAARPLPEVVAELVAWASPGSS
ncbi:MAG TPA: shikimate kinase [Planctomycetes bacterium]|nr:shikimate kinase [Planctomycetota bacterium]